MTLAPHRRWFNEFAWFNVLFFSLQLALILVNNGSFVSAIPTPKGVYLELFLTLLIQCVLYLLLTCWQTALMWGLIPYRLSPRAHQWIHGFIGLSSLAALLLTNAAFFPLSLFSRTLFPDLPHTFAYASMLIFWVPLGLLTINTIWIASKTHYLAVLLITVGLICVSLFPSSPYPVANTSLSTPNLILIGVDSLSPQSINKTLTPTLAAFINQSVWFKETISPLARTYPAWTSILTGLHPANHFAHYNLMPPNTTRADKSIAWALQHAGYQTLFATDDRRFNTIDKEFGFQTTIGPKLGINDFLMGTFNDFPLSNLLINCPLGRVLFPYNHMNRASYFSYYPHTFDHAIETALSTQQPNMPLFMAVHFTLPHWPYAFAPSAASAVNDEYSVHHREPLYNAALRAVDNQVATLLVTLEKRGYLTNSLVVLLSDHGETLYTPNSRQTTQATYQGSLTSKLETYFLRYTSTVLNKSAGHGSDLLSQAQFHCVLAFQTYQNHTLTSHPKTVATRVALMDIAPTLQAFSGIKIPHRMDGISLLPVIEHPDRSLPSRAFIMESGMLPNQFLSKDMARRLAQQYFTVGPHDEQLHLRADKLATLDAMKLYAILKDDWLLALYPTPEGYLPIVQQISTGQWIDGFNTPFALASPAHALLGRLTRFYHHPWPIIL